MVLLPENVTRFIGTYPALSIDDEGVDAGAVYSRKKAIVIYTLSKLVVNLVKD